MVCVLSGTDHPSEILNHPCRMSIPVLLHSHTLLCIPKLTEKAKLLREEGIIGQETGIRAWSKIKASSVLSAAAQARQNKAGIVGTGAEQRKRTPAPSPGAEQQNSALQDPQISILHTEDSAKILDFLASHTFLHPHGSELQVDARGAEGTQAEMKAHEPGRDIFPSHPHTNPSLEFSRVSALFTNLASSHIFVLYLPIQMSQWHIKSLFQTPRLNLA